MFSIIAAVDENFAIGYENNLLCRISADMKRFKSLTLGKKVLVGRKTFQSLPKLPGRKIIVATNNFFEYESKDVEVCHDLYFFLRQHENSSEEIFIIGGGQIYSAALPYTKKIYLTRIKNKFVADTFFPALDEKNWCMTASPIFFDEKNNLHFTYEQYERKKNIP